MKAKTKLRTEDGGIDTRRWKWPLANAKATRQTFINIISDRAQISRPEAEAEFSRALKAGEVVTTQNVGMYPGIPAYKIVK